LCAVGGLPGETTKSAEIGSGLAPANFPRQLAAKRRRRRKNQTVFLRLLRFFAAIASLFFGCQLENENDEIVAANLPQRAVGAAAVFSDTDRCAVGRLPAELSEK
jgi:hypothetical protein